MDPQQGPSQPDLLIGQTIGNYLVTQKLGEGGMGSVYLAEHPSIGKKVALKVLHSEFSTNQEVAARFFHEAKAVNDIGHPNIVDIVDFGIIQSGHGREQLVYFIMEYLAGLTLSQLIRNEAPLPPERALSIAMQVADALSASHKCGIVHRDLKPDNIILLQRGRERDFVKLLDFGIAKLTGGSAMGSHRTRTGIVMGTPAYMSPEQCEGRDTVDLRTDVYALGIVLYEMLTGRVPFVGDGYGEILVQHLTQRPVPPSSFRVLQPHVEAVVLKALEKRADMRYPSMEELMRAMADPVGYVESHGGVAGFPQRQLTPSTGPLPMTVRLTPAPLTPLPGTLIAPHPMSVPPGHMQAPMASPVPTTLGTATGQIQPPRTKAAYIVAALVVVAVAVASIIVVAGRDKGPIVADTLGSAGSANAGHSGSGDVAASGTGSAAGSAGGNAGSTAGSATTTGTAAGSTPESGSASAGSATSGLGSATVPTVPTVPDHTGSDSRSADARAGSGTPREGSDSGAAQVDPNTEIKVTSSPEGAEIWVEGAATGKITPDTVLVPHMIGKKLSITLHKDGYTSVTRSIDASRSSAQHLDLVKKTRPPVPPGPGSATRPPTTPNPHPDGNPPPPKAGDPDLMRP